MRVVVISALAALLALGFAPAPLPRRERERAPNAAELARLQGTWEMVTYNGSTNGPYQVDVRGSRMTFRQGERVFSVWTVSLDVRSRTLFQTRNGGQPEHNRYQLIGDELITAWFVNDRSKGSPPTLEQAPGVTVVVYRRVRP
jgi:hypothetical protein